MAKKIEINYKTNSGYDVLWVENGQCDWVKFMEVKLTDASNFSHSSVYNYKYCRGLYGPIVTSSEDLCIIISGDIKLTMTASSGTVVFSIGEGRNSIPFSVFTNMSYSNTAETFGLKSSIFLYSLQKKTENSLNLFSGPVANNEYSTTDIAIQYDGFFRKFFGYNHFFDFNIFYDRATTMNVDSVNITLTAYKRPAFIMGLSSLETII